MHKEKHLLILSGPMGSGHIQAANALAEAAAELYPDVHVTHLNIAELMTPGLRLLFTGFYHFLLRHCSFIWKFIYVRSNVHEKYHPPFMRILNIYWRKRTEQRLLRRIHEIRPDYIVCTHFFAAAMVGGAKKRKEIECPTASVITDFSVHWSYIQEGIDHFFVAGHDMALITHLCGIPLEKITVSGCPVRRVFSKTYTDADIENFAKSLALSPNKNYVMVTMGGESIGRVSEISKFLLSHFPEITVIATCGKNMRMHDKLCALRQTYPDRLIPLTYTEDLYQYMLVSSAVISKPGGITVSECLTFQIPLIILDPIPGHEEKNALYLSTHGLAALPETLYGLSFIDLSLDAPWKQLVRENQRRHSATHAGEIILKQILGDVDVETRR